jgi:glycosyltransferase involved in cell wall biosynthesis
MIQRLVAARMQHVELAHVRMAFSDEMSDIGRLRLHKLAHLGALIARIWKARFVQHSEVLYYPPAGPHRVPIYRDMAILLSCRWLFRRTVFHFHAGGIGDFAATLAPWERRLFRLAYGRPDCAIVLSERNPADGLRLGARRSVTVPYGIPDEAGTCRRQRPSDATLRILYVGSLRESKGVLVLLEAACRLRERGFDFQLEFVGEWSSPAFREQTLRFVAEHQLTAHCLWRGRLTGASKLQAYADADLFCFPTFFEAETFGVVLLEAMQCGLPVVASDFRGVGSVVAPDVSGFLVPPRDAGALAERVAVLLADAERRRAMGDAGRRRYCEHFTLERWLQEMESALLSVREADPGSQTNTTAARVSGPSAC